MEITIIKANKLMISKIFPLIRVVFIYYYIKKKKSKHSTRRRELL